MRVNIKGCDQVAPPRRGERISPAGTFDSSPLRSGGKGVKDNSVPEGTIEPSLRGSHTASRAQAANRSSLSGRVIPRPSGFLFEISATFCSKSLFASFGGKRRHHYMRNGALAFYASMITLSAWFWAALPKV
jgi:hypothetical protein